MKMTKWIASIAVVALVSSSAMAGTTWLSTRNWEFGTLYTSVDENGNPAAGTWEADDFTPTNDFADLSTEGRWAFRPSQLRSDEDTWGIAVMDAMSGGALSGSGLQVSPGGATVFSRDPSSSTNPGYQIVGVFWGGQDQYVNISETGTATINAEDLMINLWAVDNDVLPDVLATLGRPDISEFQLPGGSGNRTAGNLFDGLIEQDWIDDGDARLLIEGKANFSGFSGAAGGVVGSSTVYLSIDDTVNATYDGLWNSAWDSGVFDLGGNTALIPNAIQSEIGNLIDPDETADIWLQFGLSEAVPAFDFDFQIRSIDDGGVQIIPEPMTMLAFGLGIGGIGSYIRKRRNA